VITGAYPVQVLVVRGAIGRDDSFRIPPGSSPS
jgi:hypothetical protein